jgi:hypothetical protein
MNLIGSLRGNARYRDEGDEIFDWLMTSVSLDN